MRRTATFITSTGQEISMLVIKSQGKIWVERNGVPTEFCDPLYDPKDGLLSFVALDPPDRTIQPRSTSRIRHLVEIGL
jgi:hypothetical protein